MTGVDTLYVSDLDGTLLAPDGVISARTRDGVNRLVAAGLPFTIATARSYHSARRVAAGLDLRLPLAVYGGAFVVDPAGVPLRERFLPEADVAVLLAACAEHDMPPLVYSMRDGRDRITWVRGEETEAVQRYLTARGDDPRLSPVAAREDLPVRGVFSVSVLGPADPIARIAAQVRARVGDDLTTTDQHDTYWPDLHWFETTARDADKGDAVTAIRELTGARRVVAFGDNLNDLPMLAVADLALAVEGSVPAVLEAAHGTVPSNRDDGVLDWLERNADPARAR